MQHGRSIEQREYIETTLRRLISDYIEPGSDPQIIALDIPLLEQGVDSFDFMKLLIDIEDVFQIALSEEDLLTQRMDTLEDLIELIESSSVRG